MYWTEPFGYWRETFGMTSVEAQHTGSSVVASNDGGIPETDCGGLVLFEPSNSYSLALALQKIRGASPLTTKQRRGAIKHFTRAESVNALLAALKLDNNGS
jgi:glycosyltransferase involved in cell wall biosynthesis